MKRTGLLLVIGAVVVVVIHWAAVASPQPTQGSSEIEQIRKEVASLRERVESLEERVKQELIPASIQDGKDRPGVINPYRGQRQVPQNWQRFEFNGLPYYICPIQETHDPVGEAKEQTAPDNAKQIPNKFK
jgi:hypothetical protein